MLAYGIITKDVNYVAGGKTLQKKNLYFRRSKTAKAVKQGTNTTLYEVVYVEVIDSMSQKETYSYNKCW